MPKESTEIYPGTLRTALNVRADFKQRGSDTPSLPEIVRVVRKLDRDARITTHIHNLAFHELYFSAKDSNHSLPPAPKTTSDSVDPIPDGKNYHHPMIWKNALGVRKILSHVPGLSSIL